MLPMVANIESSIWERVVEPSWDDLSHEAASALLQLRFQQRDTDRMNELAALASEGRLTEQQKLELEAYTRIGRMVAAFQSKARLALRQMKDAKR